MSINIFKPTVQKIIWALVLWQFISVGLMAVGTWPPQVALVNTALLVLFIVLSKPFDSVLLLILSIPFYVILPNTIIDDIPMWRVLFALMFVVWFAHLLVSQRRWLVRLFQIQRWHSKTPFTGARLKEIWVNAYRRIDSRFMPWDKVAVLFIVLALLSLLIARFPIHGFKQILFIINIYLLYIVIINVVTDIEKIKQLIRHTMYSLGIMMLLGFVQYGATLVAEPYFFWQYWATMVSSLYYGFPLANVLIYSNSWFSYSGGTQSLRMFGVLPDTHAFGVISIFFLAFLAPQLQFVKKFWQSQYNKWYLLAAVFLTSFAIIANGTRGVWLAMLAPMVLAVILLWRQVARPFMKVMMAIYGLIILLFVISPFITQGLNLIRTYDSEDNFLNRAGSIYNLSESSNVGRLEVWKSSIQYAAVHPFGLGYGNFIVSIVDRIPNRATYEEVAEKKDLRFNLPEEFVTAHSLYLQLLVELGFAGLLAFGLFWWEYFEQLVRFLKKHHFKNDFYVRLMLSLALAFIWLLAYGVFDLTILNDRVLMYLFIGLAISGLVFAKSEPSTSPVV